MSDALIIISIILGVATFIHGPVMVTFLDDGEETRGIVTSMYVFIGLTIISILAWGYFK